MICCMALLTSSIATLSHVAYKTVFWYLQTIIQKRLSEKDKKEKEASPPGPPKGGENKQPLMIANETLMVTLMISLSILNNYTINYTINYTENCPPLMIVASPLPQWSLHPLRFPRSRGTETPKGKGVPTVYVSCFKEPLTSTARSGASLLSPSSYACTGFADSKHSVDDLRLNNEYWILKSSSDQREEMVATPIWMFNSQISKFKV